MTDDTGQNPTSPPRAPDTCVKCGSLTELAERLPKALGTPTFEIFRCIACGAFEWVSQDDA